MDTNDKLYTIYMITNMINNKKYIGATSLPLKVRFGCHWSCRNSKAKVNTLYYDMFIYPKSMFLIKSLETNISSEHWAEREQFYIKKYGTYEFGYNRCAGGYGCTGYVSNEKRNAAIRQKMLGRKFPKEWKEKLSRIGKTRIGSKNPFLW